MKYLVRLYVGDFLFTVTVYIIQPVFLFAFFSNIATPHKIPFPGFSTESPKSPGTWIIYAINYCLQAIATLSVGIIASAVDMLLVVLMVQCVIQLNFLIKRLQPLAKVGDLKEFQEFPDLKVDIILREVHDAHIVLKSFVSDVNQSFKFIVLLQLFYSGLYICVSVYLVTTMTEDRSIEPFALAFSANCELGVYCFVGQYLTNKFEKLSDTLASVCWYEFTKEEKKTFLVMLHNMQQPVVIKGDLNELSFEVFRNVSLPNQLISFKLDFNNYSSTDFEQRL